MKTSQVILNIGAIWHYLRATMDDMEVASRLEFHGVAYIVTVSVLNQQLDVQVEIEDHAAQTTTATATSSTSATTATPAAANTNGTELVCWTGSFPSTCTCIPDLYAPLLAVP